MAAQNVAAHKEFVVTFTSFREEFDRDGATAHLVVRVETELMRWLSGHIKRTDTQLAHCVKAARRKDRRAAPVAAFDRLKLPRSGTGPRPPWSPATRSGTFAKSNGEGTAPIGLGILQPLVGP